MQIASAQGIRQAEQAAFAAGTATPSGLMDAVVARLRRELPFTPRRVVAYIGRGNNGGDAVGLAAAFDCPVILRHPGEKFDVSAETQRQLDIAKEMDIAATAPEPEADTLVIDGLLGSGAHGELRADYAACVREMNALRLTAPRCRTLAIDMPTGLGTGVCVQADATAAIGCVKPEMLADGAEDSVGRLFCIPLPEVDIPAECADTVLEPLHPLCRLPRRPYSLFKNRAGRVAIVAGNIGTVFGGNDQLGDISGDSIKVTVNWWDDLNDENHDGVKYSVENNSLGSVYGGGNIADYDGSTTVKVLNAALTGSVYGGGKKAIGISRDSFIRFTTRRMLKKEGLA